MPFFKNYDDITDLEIQLYRKNLTLYRRYLFTRCMSFWLLILFWMFLVYKIFF